MSRRVRCLARTFLWAGIGAITVCLFMIHPFGAVKARIPEGLYCPALRLTVKAGWHSPLIPSRKLVLCDNRRNTAIYRPE